MVRSSTFRASKYGAKMVGDVVKNRFDAQHDSMVSQATSKFADYAAVETAVKNLLNGWGIHSILHPAYMAYARKCQKIITKHSGDVAVEEICIAEAAFVTRGLDAWYLQTIAMDLFSVDIASCT